MSHFLCCCYMYVRVTVVDLTCDCCRVYIVAVIRPYIPTLFFGALILGSAGGGMKKNSEFVVFGVLVCLIYCSFVDGPGSDSHPELEQG